MGSPRVVCRLAALVLELPGCVLPDRFQQPVPGWPGAAVVELHEVLIDQGPQMRHRLVRMDSAARRDRLGCGQVESAGEHRKPGQHLALVGVQQLPRPVDHGQQSLLARQRRARTAGQQGETLVEPGVQLGHRHDSQPGRGQLDGQRDAVEPPAYPAGHRSGVLVPGERRPLLRGAVSEQPHGLGVADRLRSVILGWCIEGRNPVDTLPGDAQRLAAGGEQHGVRAALQESVRQLGARIDDVLAVIQQHQEVLPPDGVNEGVGRGQALVHWYAEHVGHGDRDEFRVLQGREVHEPYPVARAVQEPGCELEREPGLARATRAGESHQTRSGQQPAHLAELSLAADEAGHLDREVVPQLRVVQRPKWRESRRQAVRLELEDLPGPPQVLQPVQPEVRQRCARRHRVAEQGSRGRRDQGLPSVADGRHPGRPVNAETDQAGVGPRRLTGMNAHPDADPLARWPRVGEERPLHLDRRGDAGTRRREHGEERITLGIHLLAAVRGEARPDQPVMIAKHLRVPVTQAHQQRGGALDISEEKGERLRGQHPGTSI